MAIAKMNQRVKKEWVKALRSGKYKQGSGNLYYPSSKRYCCLGVLASCQGITPSKANNKGLLRDKYSFGLDQGTQNKLARWNDTDWSFKRIASYIERYL